MVFTISPYDESRYWSSTGVICVLWLHWRGGEAPARVLLLMPAVTRTWWASQVRPSRLPVIVGPDLAYNGVSYDALCKGQRYRNCAVYCGYIGGGGGEFGTGIESMPRQCVRSRLTNSTQSTFPVTVGPDLTYNGETMYCVAKVNATGTALVYCGYIGGDLGDYGAGIALDASGNATWRGDKIDGGDLPLAVGPDLTYNGGFSDAFMQRSTAGSALVYCGYVGARTRFGAGHCQSMLAATHTWWVGQIERVDLSRDCWT